MSLPKEKISVKWYQPVEIKRSERYCKDCDLKCKWDGDDDCVVFERNTGHVVIFREVQNEE